MLPLYSYVNHLKHVRCFEGRCVFGETAHKLERVGTTALTYNNVLFILRNVY